MNSMKQAGLKLFGLCVLALVLVAFSAGAAQGSVWMVKGINLTTVAQNKTVVGKLDENHGILLTVIGLNKVEFLCTAMELLNTKLEPVGAVSEASKNAQAHFSGCVTIVNGVVIPKCIPKAIGKAAGTITTEELYALLQLHSDGTGVIVVTPKVGTVLAVIHMGEACAIGELATISGALALHDVGVELNKDELEVERANHLVAEFKPLTALKVSVGGSQSVGTLDGMADIKLTSGEVWSGLRL